MPDKSSGVKIIRKKGKDSDSDEDEEKENYVTDFYLTRNIDHMTEEDFNKFYSHRLTQVEKDKIHELFTLFLGSKKYHNYTREIRAH